jgi:hypothetical protein
VNQAKPVLELIDGLKVAFDVTDCEAMIAAAEKGHHIVCLRARRSCHYFGNLERLR